MKDALVLGINQQHLTQGIVLILVLMEDALVLGLDAIFAGKIFVLILVLMEDALVQVKAQVAKGFDFKKS